MLSCFIIFLFFLLYFGVVFGLVLCLWWVVVFFFCWVLWVCIWWVVLFVGFWRMVGRWRLWDVSVVWGVGGVYGIGVVVLFVIVVLWLCMEKRWVGWGKEGGVGGKVESIMWGNNKYLCLDCDFLFIFYLYVF